MINRYSRPEMLALWSDERRFAIWLEIELAVLKASIEKGIVPKGAAAILNCRPKIDVARISTLEAELKHDVIAFLTSITEQLPAEGRYLHYGMTSSDLVDTGFALQLLQACEMVDKNLASLLIALKARAIEFKMTPAMGRTHGMHAEVTTFGVKLLGFYAELLRGKKRLKKVKAEIAVGKLSGAVGVYGVLSPDLEVAVLSSLGLQPESVATQVVCRDRHAAFFTSLALIASSIERLSVELRHLQRTEVAEVEEPFNAGQKGSSAMPHKRNPILSENLSGLARLMRGYSQAAMENIVLWHERDISHSGVERVIGPDATILLDFMIVRARMIIEGMRVDPQKMAQNIAIRKGDTASGKVLLALVEAGIGREDAYKIMQRHTHEQGSSAQGSSVQHSSTTPLLERLKADPEVSSKVASAVLERAFDQNYQLRFVDQIFERVLAEEM